MRQERIEKTSGGYANKPSNTVLFPYTKRAWYKFYGGSQQESIGGELQTKYLFAQIMKTYGIMDVGDLTWSFVQELQDMLIYINNPKELQKKIDKMKRDDMLKNPQKYKKEEISKMFKG